MSALVDLRDVTKTYSIRSGRGWRQSTVTAVDSVTLTVASGESVGLVGESGSGKTTLSRIILRLVKPTRGQVLYQGEDVFHLRGAALAAYRRSIQPVFQDPSSSLNPRLRVRDIIAEPAQVAGQFDRRNLRAHMAQLITAVALPADALDRYPHEFSGGQRQRIAIARALSSSPELVILDEPVSGLDLSLRAQLLALLARLREQHGLAYLFIAHDLPAVSYLCERVVVMYRGAVVEEAGAEQLFNAPRHPYTQALLAATLSADPLVARVRRNLVDESVATAVAPTGCRFRLRCPHAFDRCSVEEPQLRSVGPGQTVACHLESAVSTPVGRTRVAGQ
jgi:oligopeptide/dipeptide ABC transporter ATP-binding protein